MYDFRSQESEAYRNRVLADYGRLGLGLDVHLVATAIWIKSDRLGIRVYDQ